MSKLLLFSDGSVNTDTNTGYGAYLAVPEDCFLSKSADVKIKAFKETSSTKLELQTLLWALEEISSLGKQLIIYTDSQNIIGLQRRRKRLEQNNYHSKNNKLLTNSELYKEFYKLTDKIDCEFVKVRGHKASREKDDIDRLFTLVDRASRNAVRKNNQQ